MKITKTQLKNIILEELERIGEMRAGNGGGGRGGGGGGEEDVEVKAVGALRQQFRDLVADQELLPKLSVQEISALSGLLKAVIGAFAAPGRQDTGQLGILKNRYMTALIDIHADAQKAAPSTPPDPDKSAHGARVAGLPGGSGKKQTPLGGPPWANERKKRTRRGKKKS